MSSKSENDSHEDNSLTTSNKQVLSKTDISKLLMRYEKKEAKDIKLGTHLRYFSALRDKNHNVITRSDGTPKVTFKRGGFLKTVNYEKKYIQLSNIPIQQIAENKKKNIVWSVPLDEHTTLYAIKQPKKVQEELTNLRNEVDIIKNQIHKIKKQKKN